MRLRASLLLALCLLTWSVVAGAQPAEQSAPASEQAAPATAGPATAPPASDEPPPVSQETKLKARRHFLKGLALLREQAWAPALAEFLASLDLYPTRVATNNAGIALRKLERYDAALDMFERLLRDFQVPDSDRDEAQRQIAELRALVGTVDIQGAEPGAAIVISSQERGEYPPVTPLRVPAGNHVVRVYKEGFEPFETRVDVAGGRTVVVEAKLVKLSDSGRLQVRERNGNKLAVMVDNVVVGQTPWEGRVGVGEHMVMLRGEGQLGSQPTAATVRSQDLTQLTLLAEQLEASLRVDPTPPGASVWINSVNVGSGVWLGRLKVGSHKIEVKAEGFLAETREVTLTQGKRESLQVELERDEDAPRWRKPSKWTMDFGVGAVLAPTLGGDVASSCGDGCSNTVGAGGLAKLHAGYELGSGLGFGLEIGGLLVTKQVDDRSAELQPLGLTTANAGSAQEDLRLTGFLAGVTAGYHVGDTLPFVARLGAGVMAGQVRDERRGSFTARDGSPIDAYAVASFDTATYFYVEPTLRLGFPFADSWEVSGQLSALLLIGLSQPKWDPSIELGAGSDGIGGYPSETLMGPFVVLPTLGVNLRYTFGGAAKLPEESQEGAQTAKR